MPIRSLKDADIGGRKVLLRAGFDVEIENGIVTDASRIVALVPTMKYILDHGAALIIMAHQGRPKGQRVEADSQRPLIPVLEKSLGRKIAFADSCIGDETRAAAAALQPGEVLLLENLRYDAREEKNDPTFAEELALLAEVYVNDAFSNAHREHASMAAITALLPSYAGLQLEQEVKFLSQALHDPKRPLLFVVSGAKMETKVPVIRKMLGHADDILVGGAIANTFLAAQGHAVGTSLYEQDRVAEAQKILAASEGLARIHMPVDVTVADSPKAESSTNAAVDSIPDTQAIFDMGTDTMKSYEDLVKKCGMVVWNGPLGYYENPLFGEGTKAFALCVQEQTKKGELVSIVGGGDTIDFHTRNNLDLSGYSFVSTGGGAMLEFIAGAKLPAIDALQD